MKPGDASLTGLDRREHHRPHFFAEVEILGAPPRRCRTADLTMDGMLIETPEPLAPGTEFRARLYLPEGPPLEADCIVKREVEGVGMGVLFAELEPVQLTRLRKLLENLPH